MLNAHTKHKLSKTHRFYFHSNGHFHGSCHCSVFQIYKYPVSLCLWQNAALLDLVRKHPPPAKRFHFFTTNCLICFVLFACIGPNSGKKTLQQFCTNLYVCIFSVSQTEWWSLCLCLCAHFVAHGKRGKERERKICIDFIIVECCRCFCCRLRCFHFCEKKNFSSCL